MTVCVFQSFFHADDMKTAGQQCYPAVLMRYPTRSTGRATFQMLLRGQVLLLAP